MMFVWWGLFPLLLLSVIPAYIAQTKGMSFGLWYVYGFFLLPIALVHSLVTTNQNKKCPYCAEFVKPEALVCKHCAKDLPADEAIEVETIEADNFEQGSALTMFGVIGAILAVLYGLLLLQS